MSAFYQLVLVHVLRTLALRRVWLVPPAFFLFGLFFATQSNFGQVKTEYGSINVLDVLASVYGNPILDMWLFGAAFAALIGDSLALDARHGTWALTLPRVRSRTSWWLAKLAAIGVLALLFVLVATMALWVAGLAAGIPFSLHDSPAARSAVPIDRNFAWYQPVGPFPLAVFLPLMALYKAAVLWALGSLMLAISAPSGDSNLSFGMIAGWVVVSIGSESAFSHVSPHLRLIQLPFFLSYTKHLGWPPLLPWTTFEGILVAMILGSAMYGSWRLQRAEL